MDQKRMKLKFGAAVGGVNREKENNRGDASEKGPIGKFRQERHFTRSGH